MLFHLSSRFDICSGRAAVISTFEDFVSALWCSVLSCDATYMSKFGGWYVKQMTRTIDHSGVTIVFWPIAQNHLFTLVPFSLHQGRDKTIKRGTATGPRMPFKQTADIVIQCLFTATWGDLVRSQKTALLS